MNSKIALVAFITLTFTFSLSVQSYTVEAQSFKTIIINPDGSIKGTDRIMHVGNIYTFTDQINGSIIVEKDNIVIDGAGHTIRGSGNITNFFGQVWPTDSPKIETGFTLVGRTHVTIQNLTITDFLVPFQLLNSTYITIQNINLIYNGQGIRLYNSSSTSILKNSFDQSIQTSIIANPLSHSNIISENKIIDSVQAIRINSSNNTISGNFVRHSIGISISYGMYNRIVGNNIVEGGAAINFYEASFNIVSQNNMTGNSYGIFGGTNETIFENNIEGCHNYGIQSCYDSLIYRNNFVNNSKNVVFIGGDPIGINTLPAPNANLWDNGTQGNYWSDYNGTDANGDGIGDTSYMPYPNNTDRYPLMRQINVSAASPTPTPFPTPSPSIPEFPSWIILPIFAVATLLFVILIRRKKNTIV